MVCRTSMPTVWQEVYLYLNIHIHSGKPAKASRSYKDSPQLYDNPARIYMSSRSSPHYWTLSDHGGVCRQGYDLNSLGLLNRNTCCPLIGLNRCGLVFVKVTKNWEIQRPQALRPAIYSTSHDYATKSLLSCPTSSSQLCGDLFQAGKDEGK